MIGWQHQEDSLTVRFYEASSGKPVRTVEATRNGSINRVESFRIYPPGEKYFIQIGRFTFGYQVRE